MSYSQALEAQIAAARYFHEHGRDLLAEHKENAALVTMTAHALSHGDSYYWSRELSLAMEKVASTVPPDARLVPEDLPSDWGFFLFAHPVEVDARGAIDLPDIYDHREQIAIAALNWGSIETVNGKRGIGVCAYERADCGCLIPEHMTSIFPPETLGEFLAGLEHSGDALTGLERSAQLGALLYASLAFIRDRIVTTPARVVERHVRRRLAREGYHHEPLVRVVELRRKAAHSEHAGESESVEWSHQWIVSGHWRQQWYPSLDTTQPRWIMPYVKGPEDKPLKPPRAKVFAVVR